MKASISLHEQDSLLWRLRCGEINMISAPAEWLFGASSEFSQVITINAEIFVLAHENERLRALVRNTMNTIDGRVLRFICMTLYPGNS